MKMLILALSLVISASAFASSPNKVATPDNSVFDQVAIQARNFDFFGYDVLACFSANGRLAVGGVSFWNVPLQIYLQSNSTGSVVATKRVSGSEELQNIKFMAGDNEVTLSLGRSNYAQPISTMKNSFLTVGPREIAEKITCFFRNSGLE